MYLLVHVQVQYLRYVPTFGRSGPCIGPQDLYLDLRTGPVPAGPTRVGPPDVRTRTWTLYRSTGPLVQLFMQNKLHNISSSPCLLTLKPIFTPHALSYLNYPTYRHFKHKSIHSLARYTQSFVPYLQSSWT